MRIIYYGILLILNVSISVAQVTEEWVQRYNGTANGIDEAIAIAADNTGNVYITGRSQGSNSGFDYVTIKYDTDGNEEWVQRYGGTGDDEAIAIALDNQGNVLVTGYATIGSTFDYATIKYNSDGIELWVQTYNGPGNSLDQASSVAVDDQGNVYVTGVSVDNNSGRDYATVKYNTDGAEQWVSRYNGPGNFDDLASSISVDQAGNVYVTGSSIGASNDNDYATIKYSTNGVEQWVKRYNNITGGTDQATAIKVDNFQNIYVTGNSQGSGTNFDYSTIKYDTNGNVLWTSRYNYQLLNGDDWAYSLALDNSGNVYVTGISTGFSMGDYLTVKYNSDGIEQWNQRYNGPNNRFDQANSIAVDNLGYVYVTGYSYVGVESEYATLKYNADGILQWSQRYIGPGNGADAASSIAIDGSWNVYVTGRSQGSGTGRDYATIKYSQEVVGTTLTMNSPAGSQILEVASTNGFSIGDNIIINPGGATEETNTITGFGSILLQTPLQFDHISGEQVVTIISTAVEEIFEPVAREYFLHQNYPNPFNPSTKIKFTIPSVIASGTKQSQFVSLKVYDVLGNEVSTLVNEEKSAGTYEATFDASGLTSGIYFYKLQAGNFTESKKMILLK